jgi:hypothetical protein
MHRRNLGRGRHPVLPRDATGDQTSQGPRARARRNTAQGTTASARRAARRSKGEVAPRERYTDAHPPASPYASASAAQESHQPRA